MDKTFEITKQKDRYGIYFNCHPPYKDVLFVNRLKFTRELRKSLSTYLDFTGLRFSFFTFPATTRYLLHVYNCSPSAIPEALEDIVEGFVKEHIHILK